MPLVIATGSNLGNSVDFLQQAKSQLARKFHMVAESQIYHSQPVDYLEQPDFFNQVLEFETPQDREILECFQQIRAIEKKLGKEKTIPKGPREIDIDLIFWDDLNISLPQLQVPHPRWNQREFVVLPLLELPCKTYFKKIFDFPHFPDVTTRPINA
jgi:2-amino-4-hydroxy-6-hydroxymethyldihydropteridine diphosphokinase